jgi:hypothetical protein
LTSIEIHAVIRAAINECQPEATVVIMADAPVYRMDPFERDAVLDEPAAETYLPWKKNASMEG